MKDLGRNDPCHCGSGKKYKKCHLINNFQQEEIVEKGLPTINYFEEIRQVAQSHHAYRILGVEANFTLQELKSKYREKIKSLHPDKAKGKELEFQLVHEAYKFLLKIYET